MVPSRNAATTELIELARVAGEFEGTGLEIIPQVGPTFDQWAVELMTDMSVAAQRPINWNVMTVNAGQLQRVPGQARGGRRRPRQGRQDRRAHHSDQLRRTLLVQQRVRARRDARLGRCDALVTRREAPPPPRPRRTRGVERQGAIARQPDAHDRRLGHQGHLRRRGPGERAVPRTEGGRHRRRRRPRRVGRAVRHRGGRRAQHELRHAGPGGDRRRLEGAASKCGATRAA